MSWRFQSCLEDFTPDIEHYSIDEVFVKMPLSSLRSLSETGHEMRRQVRALTGVPVSVGFAETKTLAKLAIEIAIMWNIKSRFALLKRFVPDCKIYAAN